MASQIRLLVVLLFAAPFLAGLGLSQEASSGKKPLWDRNDFITCGLEGPHGNLWFGTTTKGLIRFDGQNFQAFTTKDGLSSNNVSSMLWAKDGSLWLGTANGLSKFDGEKFTQVPLPKYKGPEFWGNPNLVVCLHQDRRGDLWIGTWGAGAYRYDGKVFSGYLADHGLVYEDGYHHSVIQSIVEDHYGNLWFTSMSHGGVSRFDGEEFTHFDGDDGLGDMMVLSSFTDRAGNLWFGGKDHGLFRWNGKGFVSVLDQAGELINNVVCFYELGTDKMLLGRDGGGNLLILQKGEVSAITNGSNQPFRDIRFLLEDKAGRLWIGGRRGALWSYDGNDWVDRRTL